MPLFNSSRIIENQIDEFLDTVAEGALVYRSGVNSYLENACDEFDASIEEIGKLESRADKISREVEAHLYSHSLIPDHRGDVLGLLEHTDNIIDTAKMSLMQFSVEHPEIPTRFTGDFRKLVEASYQAADSVVVSTRAFFRDARAVKDTLFKVHHYEREADTVSDTLKRAVFASDLDLAHKTQLRYFAINVEKLSDRAEEVADRLAIYAIKRNI